MADNTQLNPGVGGAVIATDEIGGVHFQKIKVVFGGDDSATQIQVIAPLPTRLSDGAAHYDLPPRAPAGAAHGANQPGVRVLGSDGTNDRQLRTAADGTVRVDPTGTTTQPVSVASLPLPAGAATEATLSALNAKVTTFDLDTGGGTQNVQGVSLRKSASGGSVELGTAADPLRTRHSEPASNRRTTGTLGAAGDVLVLSAEGLGAARWRIEAGLGGATTVVFEGTVNPSATDSEVSAHWFPIETHFIKGITNTSIDLFPELGDLLFSGMHRVRLRVSAYGSGSSTAWLEGSEGPNVIRVVVSGNTRIGVIDNDDNSVKIGGKGTAAAPSAVVEGARVGASFDLQSRLRVTGDNAAPVPVSDAGGSLTVDTNSTNIAPNTVTGSLTANGQSSVLEVGGYGSATFSVTGTWVGTLGFDVSPNGTNWFDLEVIPAGSGTPVVTTTGNGVWSVDCGGHFRLRIVFDAFTSGQADVRIQATPAGGKAGRSITVVSVPANQSINVAQVAGTATSVNVGNADAGTQRVVLASNQAPVEVKGNLARGAADAGLAVKIGGVGFDNFSIPLNVDNGDRTDLLTDLAGRLRVTGDASSPVYVLGNDGDLTLPGTPATFNVSGKETSSNGTRTLRLDDDDPSLTDYGLVVRQVSPLPNHTASGTLNALNAEVNVRAEGTGEINWEIDSGLTGTVVFEGTTNDSTWFALKSQLLDESIVTSVASFPNRGTFTTVGWSKVRLRVSAFTSGSSAARVQASAGTGMVRVVSTNIDKFGGLPAAVFNVGGLGIPAVAFGDVTTGVVGSLFPLNADDKAATLNGLLGAAAGYEFDGTAWDRVRHSFKQTTTGITGNGAGSTLDLQSCPMSRFSMMVDRTAGSSAFDVVMEGSIDGTNWEFLVAHSGADGGTVFVSNALCDRIRYNVRVVGSGNTLTVVLMAGGR